MHALERRLRALEASNAPDDAPVYVWLYPDETPSDALISRWGAGPYPAQVYFARWATSANDATPDPSGMGGGDDEAA